MDINSDSTRKLNICLPQGLKVCYVLSYNLNNDLSISI